MYIHEAIAAATPEKPWITRTVWVSSWNQMDVAIRLTPPAEDLKPLTVTARTKIGSCTWYPLKADLLADDWIPVPMPDYRIVPPGNLTPEAANRALQEKNDRRQRRLAAVEILIQILVSVTTVLLVLRFGRL